MTAPLRIAMWSGPRNISTALLRAWGNRPDTFVCDEPLYAHYLVKTGRRHPGREEVIAHHETDLNKVLARLTGRIPEGKTIFYQKHMAHHLLPGIDREWLRALQHCLLIRRPDEMLTSLLEVLPDPTFEDTGLPQQVEIVRWVMAQHDQTPPIIDARDVLEDPRAMLTRLCERLGIEFTDAMLSWSPGGRPTDGIWARHWYASVERSTAFTPYQPKSATVPEKYRDLLARCEVCYEEIHALRLQPQRP